MGRGLKENYMSREEGCEAGALKKNNKKTTQRGKESDIEYNANRQTSVKK